MHRGVPLSVKYFVRSFKTVRVSVFLQTCAVGHLPRRSIATKIYTLPRVFDLIGPAKSNWIYWFGSVKISRLFFSVDGNCVIIFLPAALHFEHVSDFFFVFPDACRAIRKFRPAGPRKYGFGVARRRWLYVCFQGSRFCRRRTTVQIW